MDLIKFSETLLIILSTILGMLFIGTTIGTRLERRAERKRNQERVNRINEIK